MKKTTYIVVGILLVGLVCAFAVFNNSNYGWAAIYSFSEHNTNLQPSNIKAVVDQHLLENGFAISPVFRNPSLRIEAVDGLRVYSHTRITPLMFVMCDASESEVSVISTLNRERSFPGQYKRDRKESDRIIRLLEQKLKSIEQTDGAVTQESAPSAAP